MSSPNTFNPLTFMQTTIKHFGDEFNLNRSSPNALIKAIFDRKSNLLHFFKIQSTLLSKLEASLNSISEPQYLHIDSNLRKCFSAVRIEIQRQETVITPYINNYDVAKVPFWQHVRKTMTAAVIARERWSFHFLEDYHMIDLRTGSRMHFHSFLASVFAGYKDPYQSNQRQPPRNHNNTNPRQRTNHQSTQGTPKKTHPHLQEAKKKLQPKMQKHQITYFPKGYCIFYNADNSCRNEAGKCKMKHECPICAKNGQSAKHSMSKCSK